MGSLIRRGARRIKVWIWRHGLALCLITLGLTFLTVYFWPRIFIAIGSGQAAIVWRRFGGGTAVHDVYLEGQHVFNPWDRVYIYNIQKQGLKFEQDALCSNGLQIHVQSALRFRPHRHRLAILHQWYGPNYVDALIVPEAKAAIQEIIGAYLPEQIYSLRRSDLESRMLDVAVAEIGPEDIELLDLTLVSISLPTRIQDAIQKKLEEDQMSQALDFRLQREQKEATRKEIEAKGIAAYSRIVGKDEALKWKGIEATQDLAKSPNSKVIVIGGRDGLPFVLGEGAMGVK